MSKQYPGGFITKSPTAPTTNAAPGIWTLEQAMQYIKAGTWPGLPDAQFNYVTMLLHGDGTNAAQNNTFLDSSSNAYTVTRNGNTTQGTFTPYGSNWSNYFNGSADYLTMPDNANYVISGDFTMEAWIFPTSFAGTNGNTVLAQWPGAVATNCAFIFQVNSTGKVYLAYGIGGTNANVSGTSLSCTLNAWNHVAITRSGTTVRFFVNGSLDSTTSTVSGAFNDSTGVMSVGRINAGDSGYFSGYISNCRLVIGTALYTAAFTPSTTPLTAVSGTQVLVCQSNRFLDASSNNATITAGGSPSVQRFNPFGTSTAYSTSVIGGSGYFDGNGDYLTIGSSGGTAIGTSDFTVAFWVYLTNTSVTQIDYRPASTNGAYITIGLTANTSIDYTVNGSSVITSSTAPTLNAWSYIAVSRVSGSTRLFIDGVQAGSTWADSTNYLASNGNIWWNAFVGARPGTGYVAGYILVKTGLYSTTFTPPTTPPTAITNTQTLLNFTNGAIFDNAMMNDLETVGNAQISTSVVKYGTGSLAFDGSGDYLVSPYNPNQEFGSGNLTWEMWINTTNSVQYATLYAKTPASFATGMWSLMMNMASSTAGDVGVYMANYSTSTPLLQTTGVSVRDGAWHHIAVVRNGSSWVLYVDGTSRATQTWSGTIAVLSTSGPYIGKDQFYGRDYNGYIDDLRITKGYARYTANFTPPTAAFQNTGPI